MIIKQLETAAGEWARLRQPKWERGFFVDVKVEQFEGGGQ